MQMPSFWHPQPDANWRPRSLAFQFCVLPYFLYSFFSFYIMPYGGYT